jgi:hypothetical protein
MQKEEVRSLFLQFLRVAFFNAVDSATFDVISIDSVEEVDC